VVDFGRQTNGESGHQCCQRNQRYPRGDVGRLAASQERSLRRAWDRTGTVVSHVYHTPNELPSTSHRLLRRVGIPSREVARCHGSIQLRRREVRPATDGWIRRRWRMPNRGGASLSTFGIARGIAAATTVCQQAIAELVGNPWHRDRPQAKTASPPLDKLIDGEWPYVRLRMRPGWPVGFLRHAGAHRSDDRRERGRHRTVPDAGLPQDNFRCLSSCRCWEGDYLDVSRDHGRCQRPSSRACVQSDRAAGVLLALQLPPGRRVHAEPARGILQPGGAGRSGNASSTASCGLARCAAYRGWRR